MTFLLRDRRAGGLLTVVLAALLVGSGAAVASACDSADFDLAAAPTTIPVTPVATDCASITLASMSEEQRIGQLFMIAIGNSLPAVTRDAIARFHFGSITFAVLSTVGVAGIHKITHAIQKQVTQASTGGVPFLIAANQEGGEVQALSGPGFEDIPTALDQGKLSPVTLRHAAERWGGDLHDAGLNVDLAPVADVVPPGTADHNAPIGQLKREYGHYPDVVASHVKAFLIGMRQAGIATTVKHFPGLGRVVGNTDHTASVDDTVTTRHDPYLEPFAKAIDAGVPFVMVSLATYTKIDPDHLAVFSPTIIRDMLRGDLGFDGVVMSDSMTAAAVASIPPATRAIDFVYAGGDMIVLTQLGAAKTMAKALKTRAANVPAFADRIDKAALRVLRAKDAMGLLSCVG